jgi:hypothetical protein
MTNISNELNSFQTILSILFYSILFYSILFLIRGTFRSEREELPVPGAIVYKFQVGKLIRRHQNGSHVFSFLVFKIPTIKMNYDAIIILRRFRFARSCVFGRSCQMTYISDVRLYDNVSNSAISPKTFFDKCFSDQFVVRGTVSYFRERNTYTWKGWIVFRIVHFINHNNISTYLYLSIILSNF